jgi:hypothetical protein
VFIELAGRIKHHGEALDAVLDRGRYQGLIESTNIKIRLLTRIAFGFRSPVALIAGKSEVRKNLPSLITNTSWRVSWFDESEPAVGPPPAERWINHDLLHRNSAILCLAVAVASVVEDTALIGDTDVADVRPGQLQPAIPPAPRSTPGPGGFLTRQNASGGGHFHRWSSDRR